MKEHGPSFFVSHWGRFLESLGYVDKNDVFAWKRGDTTVTIQSAEDMRHDPFTYVADMSIETKTTSIWFDIDSLVERESEVRLLLEALTDNTKMPLLVGLDIGERFLKVWAQQKNG